MLSDPFCFKKILQFKGYHRRNKQFFILYCIRRAGCKFFDVSGIKPDYHMCVKIDQGRHSFDQSI